MSFFDNLGDNIVKGISEVGKIGQHSSTLVAEAYTEMAHSLLTKELDTDLSVKALLGELVLVDETTPNHYEIQHDEFSGTNARRSSEEVNEAREERNSTDSLFGIFMGPIIGTEIGFDLGAPPQDAPANLLQSRVRHPQPDFTKLLYRWRK